MAIDIIMPQMGESVAEGTIIHWLVNEGDKVQKDQSLVAISTDKVDTEVPSPKAGILVKIIHKEDATVPVGTVIARLKEVKTGEAPSTEKEEIVPAKEKQVERKTISLTPRSHKIQAEIRLSPLVKRMAREYRIDLSKVRGTGIGGRITKQDILRYTKGKPVSAPPAAEEETEEKEKIVPVNPKRKIIAERMVESKKTAAHVTTTFEVDMSRIVKFREEHKEAFFRDEKVKLTYLPFVMLSTVHALRQHPVFNSSWSDKGIIMKKDINVGIAVSLEDGLIVPVINNADKKHLDELARATHDLAERARNKKLKPDEVMGGTFTITNYGSNGSLFGTPIILLPQIAILGMGTITKKPVVTNDAIAIRSMMYLSLSFDHRVVDGAKADKFLTTIKDGLEGWEQELNEKMPPAETGYGGVW
jgi:2-oxoglutarate dehydrogenase E2 component (dihydrolipoamide succinyltransferase)/2-oxoisovalerate dehydrogenase E2 component (dihydrolipoyl transacylase)